MAEGFSPDSNIFHDIWVNVRRQDSSHQKVRLGDFLKFLTVRLFIWSVLDEELCKFLKSYFPDYNERMVTVPVSFQYKGVQGVKTHGIVRDDGGRKGDDIGKEEKDWNKAVSGLRAEQSIFDELQRQFFDEPCLLMNGFSEHNLIKVVKSKLQKDKKGKCEALSDEVKNTKF